MAEQATQYTKPFVRVRALARRVLVVAKPGGRGDDWAAYIDAVAGKRHDDEWRPVAEDGVKLEKQIATAIFPIFDPETYRE